MVTLQFLKKSTNFLDHELEVESISGFFFKNPNLDPQLFWRVKPTFDEICLPYGWAATAWHDDGEPRRFEHSWCNYSKPYVVEQRESGLWAIRNKEQTEPVNATNFWRFTRAIKVADKLS